MLFPNQANPALNQQSANTDPLSASMGNMPPNMAGQQMPNQPMMPMMPNQGMMMMGGGQATSAVEEYEMLRMQVEEELRELENQPKTPETEKRKQELIQTLQEAKRRADEEAALPQDPNQMFLGGLLKGVGSIAGQALIPIPGVGAAIGGALGGALGNHLSPTPTETTTPVNTPSISRAYRGRSYKNGGLLKESKANKLKMGGKLSKRKLPMGGQLSPIGQDAGQFVGPTHAQGGIPIPGTNNEVEGGETVDNIQSGSYVFSDRITVPGTNETFAEYHKKLVQSGASQEEIEQLARLQEQYNGNQSSNQLEEGGFLDSILPYAGDLINIGTGLLSRPEVHRPQLADPTPSYLMSRQRINTTPQRSQIYASQRAANRTTSPVNRLAAHSASLQALGELNSNVRNQELSARQQGLSAMQNVEMANANAREQANQINAAARTNRTQMMLEGAAGASRTYQGLRNAERQENVQNNALFASAMSDIAKLPESDREGYIQSLATILSPDMIEQLRVAAGLSTSHPSFMSGTRRFVDSRMQPLQPLR